MQNFSKLRDIQEVNIEDVFADLCSLDNECFGLVCELHTISTKMGNVTLTVGTGPDTESLVETSVNELTGDFNTKVREFMQNIASVFNHFANITYSIEKDLFKESNRTKDLSTPTWDDDVFAVKLPSHNVSVIMEQQVKLHEFYTAVFNCIHTGKSISAEAIVKEMMDSSKRDEYATMFSVYEPATVGEVITIDSVISDSATIRANTNTVINNSKMAHRLASQLSERTNFETETDELLSVLSAIQQYASATNAAMVRYLVGYTALLQNIK